MAVKNKSQLKDFADVNFNANGVNSNTGANANTLVKDVVDSFVNVSDDVLSIVTNVYRAATEAIASTPTQITFSSDLPSANYEIIIFDIDGTGWENITDRLKSGFKITGLTAGNIIYLVILTN